MIDLVLGGQFDHVVETNLAQEVREPSALMAVVAAHLRPGGLAHLTVPNPRSLHRLVGVEMGLLEDQRGLGERSNGLETLRTLEADDTARVAASVGLRRVHRSGVRVKPRPNPLK